MAEYIHAVLGVKKVSHVPRAAPRFENEAFHVCVFRMCCHNAFCAIESSVLFTARAAVELLRFLGILFVIIPFLACTFIWLGLLFHIPRIFATYICRCLLNLCLWHMQAANARRAKAVSSRKQKQNEGIGLMCDQHTSRGNDLCCSGDIITAVRRSTNKPESFECGFQSLCTPPFTVDRSAVPEYCTQKCCSLCRLSVYMSGRTLLGCWCLVCCKCGKRMQQYF